MNNYYTYCITCPIRNEPIYIGEGHKKRAFVHLKRKGKHPLVQRIEWIRNQGKEPIIDFIVKDISKEEAQWNEEYLILWYGRKDLNKGPLLNLTDGGDGGKNPTLESRLEKSKNMLGRKLSKEHRENIAKGNKGKKHSQDTKDKIGKANKGNIISDNQKKIISEVNKGREPWNKGKKGLQVAWNKGCKTGPESQETKEKKSKARKGVPWSEARRTSQGVLKNVKK